MRISTKGRYALMAMLFMAYKLEKSERNSEKNDGRIQKCLSIRAISAGIGVSDGYLEQIFLLLRKEGLIKAERGPGGGYMLGLESEKIRAGDIIRAVEGSLIPVPCVDASLCPKSAVCENRHTWSGLYEGITATLDSITLAALSKNYASLLKSDEPEYVI